MRALQAYFRGTRAAMRLHEYAAAVQLAQDGLRADSTTAELQQMLQVLPQTHGKSLLPVLTCLMGRASAGQYRLPGLHACRAYALCAGTAASQNRGREPFPPHENADMQLLQHMTCTIRCFNLDLGSCAS